MPQAKNVNKYGVTTFLMTDTPIIKRQFLNSIKRGTGEAYLIVKNNPKIDFSNQIIKGALNIYAYDGQCEGNRAQYIFDIISISNQKDKIRNAVLKGLVNEQYDAWNLNHLFALTKLLAEQNDTEAKKAIYDRFLNPPIESYDWVGANEIVQLYGLNGLFYVAEKYGKYIEQESDYWQDDWIISQFQEENKHINVSEELKKEAKKNKFIRIYLDTVKRTMANQEKHNKAKPKKYKDIIDEILNSEPRISYSRRRKLTVEEVNKIAKQLIIETEKSNIEKLLDIFDFYKFPYNSQIILNLANQKRTSKDRIAEKAIWALKHLRSKDIRTFAIDKILNSRNPIEYLEILVSNYKSGDFKLLSQIADKASNEHKIEQLARIYTHIFEATKTKECKKPLEILYGKMNCALHRKWIIEILMENNVLSTRIKNEIKFDCDLKTRKLIQQ